MKPQSQPLREGSRLKGTFERAFFQPLKFERRRYLRAAELFNIAKKMPGERFGPLGPYGEKVYRVLVRFAGKLNGQIDPTWSTIADELNICLAAVGNALKLLRKHGFIDWVNRFVAAPRTVWGPQVHQTSNAYRVGIPPEAEKLLTIEGAQQARQEVTSRRAPGVWTKARDGLDVLEQAVQAAIRRIPPRKR